MRNLFNPPPLPRRSRLPWPVRLLFGLFGLLLVGAVLFYPVENWRGRRAWEKCKRELAAKGESLEWKDFQPTPVPDAQNFYKAPHMTEWFVGRETNQLLARLIKSPVNLSQPTPSNRNPEFLEWSDQFKPDFDAIREALKRPHAQIEGDYRHPATVPIPNFKTMRPLCHTLQRRAEASLMLGKPDEALKALELMHDLGRMLEGKPTGRPKSMVTPMLHVAFVGVHARTVAEGLQLRAWNEGQLAAIQKQLKQVNLPQECVEGFRSERAGFIRLLEIMRVEGTGGFTPSGGNQTSNSPTNRSGHGIFPRGWWEQNYTFIAATYQLHVEAFDPTNNVVRHGKLAEVNQAMGSLKKFNPYTFFAMLGLPNFSSAVYSTAYNQTLADQAMIACALERYRLANGRHPDSLSALTPRFLDAIPRDLMNGEPLKYRLTGDGDFVLYSAGRDMVDNGGKQSVGGAGGAVKEEGDWVWPPMAE